MGSVAPVIDLPLVQPVTTADYPKKLRSSRDHRSDRL